MLKIEENDKEIPLEGYYHHKINLNNVANPWEILRPDNGILGTLSSKQNYSFSKHIWNINNSEIFGDNFPSNRNGVLKFS